MTETPRNQVELSIATISIPEKGILHVHIKEEDELSLENAKEIVAARTKLAEGNKLAILYTSATRFVIPSKEVREYVATEERSSLVLADAFIIRSLAQRLAVRFYIRFNRPVRPTKFFENKEQALEWLRTFVKE